MSLGRAAAHFLMFLFVMLAVAAYPRGAFVLVLIPPSENPEAIVEVIGKAGGLYVAPGRFEWMAVAYSERPGFPARLLRAGALLVLNHALAVGCQQKV